MLLSLLLAALDDAADTGARRAASHEVARRLGIGWRPEAPVRPSEPTAPPSFVSLIRAARTLTRHAVASNAYSPSLCSIRLEAAILRLRQMVVEWLPHYDNLSIHRVYPGYIRPDFLEPLFPGLAYAAEDTPLLEAVRIDALLRDPTPLSRHDTDPLFAQLADALDALPEGDWTGVAHLLSADPISLRDWFTATRPSLAGRTWADLVAATDAWHGQMQGNMGCGLPVAPALVVLRWPSGVTLQRLLTKKDFAGEGASMGHCVGGGQDAGRLPNGDSDYYRKTRDGQGATYSLRAPNGVPAVTFELVYRRTFFPDEAPRHDFAYVTQIEGPEDGPLQTFADSTLQPGQQDPVPFLDDALTLLRLLRDRHSTDTGDFGSLSVDAYDRLPNVIYETDTVGDPTWFPDLPAPVRERALRAKDAEWRTRTWGPESRFWARVALAPAPDLKRLFEGKD